MSSPEVVAMAAMSVTPPANAAEHARLQSHLRAVLRLKAGCDNHNSVTALTVRTYASIVDEVVADVAGELHRAIATGLDTIDSVSQRVPPADDVIADYNAAVAAQEAEAERLRASGIFGESSARDDPSDTNRSKQTGGTAHAAKEVAGGDLYGRGPGAAKETAECPLCVQRVAASRFAHHLERCLGKGRQAVRRPAPAPEPRPPAPPKKPPSSAQVGRPPNPIENRNRISTANDVPPIAGSGSAPAPPRVRFVLNPRATGVAKPSSATDFAFASPGSLGPKPNATTKTDKKTQKTKSVNSLMGLGAMDDVPLSAIAASAKKETASSLGTGTQKKGGRDAEKANAKRAGKSAVGVAAGKVAKKETAAERRAANAAASAREGAKEGKKGKKSVSVATPATTNATVAKKPRSHPGTNLAKEKQTSTSGFFLSEDPFSFGQGGVGNGVDFGARSGLGGFGASGDSFAFEHGASGAGDGSGSTHEDFELLFDVDDSGGATGGGEGVLTGGFRDLFAS